MKEALPQYSERRVCAALSVPRASLRPRQPRPCRKPVFDELLASRAHELILAHPTFGYRRIWAMLRFRLGLRVNLKAVYRLFRLKGWFVHQRVKTARPRARGRRSQTAQSNERWAMDVTHIDCGRDGWGHLAAIIDCHDREIIGYDHAGAKRPDRAILSKPQGRVRLAATLQELR